MYIPTPPIFIQSFNFLFLSAALETSCRDKPMSNTSSTGLEFRKRTVMNNAGAQLVILLLGTPQVLEGAERCQDRATNPHRVFPLRRHNYLGLPFQQY
jgi:hypothetical protein